MSLTQNNENVNKHRGSARSVANYIHKNPNAALKDVAKALNMSYENVKKLAQSAKKKGILVRSEIDNTWRIPVLDEQTYIAQLEDELMMVRYQLGDRDRTIKKLERDIAVLQGKLTQQPAIQQPEAVITAPQVTQQQDIKAIINDIKNSDAYKKSTADDRDNFDMAVSNLLKHGSSTKYARLLASFILSSDLRVPLQRML